MVSARRGRAECRRESKVSAALRAQAEQSVVAPEMRGLLAESDTSKSQNIISKLCFIYLAAGSSIKEWGCDKTSKEF